MIEVEFKTVPLTSQRVLIAGSTSLAHAVAQEFVSRSIPTTFSDVEKSSNGTIMVGATEVKNLASIGPLPASDLLQAAQQAIGEVSILVNICAPSPNKKRISLLDYAEDLMTLCTATAERMAERSIPGCIVNHCTLPAFYAGTDLEDPMSILRGAITGITRSIARRYGKMGIRCIGVQTGLIDFPEGKEWVSESLKQVELPTKKWGTPVDLAKLVSFLALEGSYITGQTIILDGGLTAGISGT